LAQGKCCAQSAGAAKRDNESREDFVNQQLPPRTMTHFCAPLYLIAGPISIARGNPSGNL
jgi:hypothetical protein